MLAGLRSFLEAPEFFSSFPVSEGRPRLGSRPLPPPLKPAALHLSGPALVTAISLAPVMLILLGEVLSFYGPTWLDWGHLDNPANTPHLRSLTEPHLQGPWPWGRASEDEVRNLWASGLPLVAHCLHESARGRSIMEKALTGTQETWNSTSASHSIFVFPHLKSLGVEIGPVILKLYWSIRIAWRLDTGLENLDFCFVVK